MLRFNATRITLTEDDLCYHIDSIFARHAQLAKWHRRQASSGNSYDGDDDDDGIFLDSDTFSPPGTIFESDCDATQSPALEGDSAADSGPGENDSQVIVRAEEDRTLGDPLSGESSHSLSLPLDPGLPASQYNPSIPRSLVWPNSRLLWSNLAVLDTVGGLAKLLLTVVALPLILDFQENITQPENSRSTPLLLDSPDPDPPIDPKVKGSPENKPLGPLSSHFPKIELSSSAPASLLPEMKRTRGSKTASSEEHGIKCEGDNEHTQEPLAERLPNPGNTPQKKRHTRQGRESRVKKERLSSPSQRSIGSSHDDYTKGVNQSAHKRTVSRGTQTDQDFVSSTQVDQAAETLPENRIKQENIASGSVEPQTPALRPSQDPFISAMFPEPGAPEYDPTDQMRRGMQGYVNEPARRGRIARNQDGVLGQLIHPTLVDAAVFQEYVHRLIAELDRAP
ncbi:hypothetical protein BJX61DRAFT_524273 [Aspergillus egyptiacus]|nr:hypothetical protein BJX61DRAFT_524273 [Aspergillus egyptiacus]